MADKKEEKIEYKSITVQDLEAVELPAAWGNSDKQKKAVRIASEMGAVKHGLYASIPIVCKGAECPYADTCPLIAQDMAPVRERCPLEISQILKAYKDYSEELQIDEANVVDVGLLKDLIDIDVQIDRANKKLAADGDFMQDIVVTITEGGDEIVNPAIHKAVEYKDKLLKKRHEILQLLHSTRKDKAGDKVTIHMDPSSYAANLMAQARNMAKNQIIDVTPEEDDE